MATLATPKSATATLTVIVPPAGPSIAAEVVIVRASVAVQSRCATFVPTIEVDC